MSRRSRSRSSGPPSPAPASSARYRISNVPPPRPPRHLLIASGNAGKIREFREILGNDRFTWTDLAAHANVPSVDETGKTFRANACLKASYYAKRLNAWALADDSGLAVDALSGAPGVLSARWAQVNRSGRGDEANNATLLRQLQNI